MSFNLFPNIDLYPFLSFPLHITPRLLRLQDSDGAAQDDPEVIKYFKNTFVLSLSKVICLTLYAMFAMHH